jgi:hypothetical protein
MAGANEETAIALSKRNGMKSGPHSPLCGAPHRPWHRFYSKKQLNNACDTPHRDCADHFAKGVAHRRRLFSTMLNRRSFLKQSVAASTGVFYIAKTSWAQKSPGDTINMAVIGFGGRGAGHISGYKGLKTRACARGALRCR